MKNCNAFPESGDDARNEKKVKEKSKDIEGRMSRMGDAKRQRSSEEAKEIGSDEIRSVKHLRLQMRRKRGTNDQLSPRAESVGQAYCGDVTFPVIVSL
jgi:hypothetical protein